MGWLANYVREKRHGNITYFNVNRHINPTNVCVAHCKLCAFGRDPNAPGAYTFALEEIYQRARAGRARRRDGISHGRRAASRSAVRIFSGDDSRAEAALSHRAFESLYDGGSGVLRAHRQNFDQGSFAKNERCGRGFTARRRRGDFSSARAQNYLRSQSQRAAVAEHRARRRTRLDCVRMPPCFTGMWKRKKSASIIW